MPFSQFSNNKWTRSQYTLQIYILLQTTNFSQVSHPTLEYNRVCSKVVSFLANYSLSLGFSPLSFARTKTPAFLSTAFIQLFNEYLSYKKSRKHLSSSQFVKQAAVPACHSKELAKTSNHIYQYHNILIIIVNFNQILVPQSSLS